MYDVFDALDGAVPSVIEIISVAFGKMLTVSITLRIFEGRFRATRNS